MARIAYALTDQGRGHTSRVSAVAELLEERGHELVFVCGGTAREAMLDAGREVLEVPVLRHTLHNNRLLLWRSLGQMIATHLRAHGALARLTRQLGDLAPDLVITDFEMYSAHAARRLGIPCLTFNHQSVLTHARCEIPPGHRIDHLFTRGIVGIADPRRPVHTLVTALFSPEVRHPDRTTVVGPILRRVVLETRPSPGDEVVVYHNDPTGFDWFVDLLGSFPGTRFVLFNFDVGHGGAAARRHDNVRFAEASTEGFLRALAAAHAVISTAGYTLMCEALYLRKPHLVLPNRANLEQALNAACLARSGLGEAVMSGRPRRDDIAGFLNRARGYAERLDRHVLPLGNDAAVRCIEQVIARTQEVTRPPRVAPIASPGAAHRPAGPS